MAAVSRCLSANDTCVGCSTTPHTLVVPEFVGEGEALYRAAVKLELEGIVDKRLAAPYQPGVCSPDCLKIKRSGAVPAERFQHGP